MGKMFYRFLVSEKIHNVVQDYVCLEYQINPVRKIFQKKYPGKPGIDMAYR